MIEKLTRPDLLAGMPRDDTRKHIKDQKIPQLCWQPQHVIEQTDFLQYDPYNPEGKILWGAIGDKLIGYKDDRHAITIAGSRSGKTLTAMANLMAGGTLYVAFGSNVKEECVWSLTHHSYPFLIWTPPDGKV